MTHAVVLDGEFANETFVPTSERSENSFIGVTVCGEKRVTDLIVSIAGPGLRTRPTCDATDLGFVDRISDWGVNLSGGNIRGSAQIKSDRPSRFDVSVPALVSDAVPVTVS